MPPENDPPKSPFSAEQIESLNSMMGQTVNNILTARLKTSEKQLLEKLTPSIGEALKTQLPELLKDLRPAPVDDDRDGKNKGKRGGDDVALATLEKKVAEQTRANEELVRKLQAADQRRREVERQRHVNEALAAGGITDPFKQELALSYLDRKKRVAWSGDEDDATLLWNDDINPVSFNEGFASWLKSDEAKHFLPPSGAKGSGSRPAGGAPQTGGKPTREQQFEMIGAAIRDRLGEM